MKCIHGCGPATHTAKRGNILAALCPSCAWANFGRPVPATKLRPMTAAWRLWMFGKGGILAIRKRIAAAATAWQERA